MKRRLLVVIPVIILAIVAVAFILQRNSGVKSDEIKVSGVIEVTSAELSFKVPGKLIQRLVDEGEMVESGQVLARIEDNELKDERNARLAEKNVAEAGLADLQAGSRQEEIAQGVATLARVKSEADRSARDAARMEELYRLEIIALRDLESARAGRDSSAAAFKEAAERLKLLRAGPRKNAVDQARARVESASTGVALSETRLSYSMLIAPMAGLVLAKHAEPGEILAAGAPVVTLGKMNEVWLRAYIPENELGKVKLQQVARITVDTWPGRIFEGRITFISPQAEFTPKNVQTTKERVKLVYRIKISLANPKMELKPGMPADALIVPSP